MKLKVQMISIALCMMLILSTSIPMSIFAEEHGGTINHAQNSNILLTGIMEIAEVTTPPALGIMPFTIELYSGIVGTAPWRLYDDGTLVIDGGAGRQIQTGGVSPWLSHANAITRIIFTDSLVAGANLSRLFEGLTNVVTIEGLYNIDTKNVTTFRRMFDRAFNLETVGDLSNWDTSNVTDMAYMFSFAHSIESLNVTDWDTSNVIEMRDMFHEANSLTEIIGICGWDTGSVTSMLRLFCSTHSLTHLDLSSWNTGNVTSFRLMFNEAFNLETVGDLSNWDTSNVTDMVYMFSFAHSIENLNVTGWDTSNVTQMRDMFREANSLTEITGIYGWNTSNITNMSNIFRGAYSLTSLDLSGWNTSNVTNMGNMFLNASALREITFGENFQFALAGNPNLPPVPTNAIYAGRWRNMGIGANQPWDYSLQSSELVATSNTINLADTWIWETVIRQYHINYIYVDFMHPSTQGFLAGNLYWTELVHILGNTPSLLNRTYETGTFVQVLRELPIPALSGWELIYSYIIFQNPTLGVSGHVSQLPPTLDVDDVSGNIIIIVLFI